MDRHWPVNTWILIWKPNKSMYICEYLFRACAILCVGSGSRQADTSSKVT
jgi:hypothetical protein